MSTETIEIASRFNGPPGSGHGGYVSGRLAAVVGEPAEVTLRNPTPLDKPLRLESSDGGVRLLDGETLIAEAVRSEPPKLDVPAPVGAEEAERARGGYRGGHGIFKTCFVCGIGREDAQRVYAGEVEDGSLVASPWNPSDPWLDDGTGVVRAEFVWSVLDCPTYYGFYAGRDLGLAMLGRFAVTRVAEVRMRDPHVIAAWRIGREARKLLAGSALFSAAGELCAYAHATLIEIEEIPAGARG